MQASAGIAHGEVFLPAEVPLNSLFGRYLATSLPVSYTHLDVYKRQGEKHGLALVPDNTDTAWFQDHVGHGRSVELVLFPRSRVKFCKQDGQQHAQGLPGGVAIVAYGEEAGRRLMAVVEAGKLTGTVLKLSLIHI